MSYTNRPLDASTWDAFAELVERNNGVFGGCWCIGYHPERGQRGISHRAVKEERVRTDRAHAALVFDEDGVAQGWCQFGSPEELPNIKHRREYDKDAPAGLSRVLLDRASADPGVPDGLKVDVRGNVFGTGPGGVWVCRPDGTLLGRIVLPELPANLAWGEDGSVLFLTARTSVYRLPTKTRGTLPA